MQVSTLRSSLYPSFKPLPFVQASTLHSSLYPSFKSLVKNMSLPVSPSPVPIASQNCPVCGRILKSKDPRRSVLRHIQSLRKKGDPAHTQYYDEAPDIRKRRRKDEISMGSPLTRKAERR